MKRTKTASDDYSGLAEQSFINLMSADAEPEDWDRHAHLTKTSEDYRRAFAECESIWRSLDEVGAAALSRDELSAAIRAGRSANEDIAPSAGAERFAGLGGYRTAAIWAVAVVAAALGALAMLDGAVEENRFTTATAEHRDVELSDGSTLQLGARTTVTVRYGDTMRLVILESGELLATVAHDEDRPFVVATDDMMVKATGTAFNTRDGDDYSIVSVVEGRVRVIPRRQVGSVARLQPDSNSIETHSFDSGAALESGQQVRGASTGELDAVVDVEIDRVVSWQVGQLYFLEDTLSTVFGDVMRYSDVSFQITDPALRERVYTGSFNPDKLDAWLDAMERAYSLKTTRMSNGWIAIAPADE